MFITQEDYEKKVSKCPPIGSTVIACLYNLRFYLKPGESEWRRCIVVGYTTPEQMKDGYQFGIIVEYKDRCFWVMPEHCKLEEDFNEETDR